MYEGEISILLHTETSPSSVVAKKSSYCIALLCPLFFVLCLQQRTSFVEAKESSMLQKNGH